jgi:hypothetical protein
MDVNFLYGTLNLGFLGYVVAAFVMVQFTFMAVTLYLHRDATTAVSICIRRYVIFEALGLARVIRIVPTPIKERLLQAGPRGVPCLHEFTQAGALRPCDRRRPGRP